MTIFRELSQHILDIAENGIKAGAKRLVIEVHEDLRADQLTILVADNGSGMSPEFLQRVTDPWVTSRTTRKVGLGIPFFKQVAEMCGGAFSITSELGVGTTTRATFQHSHIDRPPLGDMIGTLLCIIVGCPQIDLFYHHQLNAREFIFDTGEVRAILGDEVALSDPEVLGFLRSTLEEGAQSLLQA